MGFQGWFQAWSQGSRPAKTLDPWDQAWNQAKSLKFILIDSNFLPSPVLRPPVTLGVSPVFLKNFSFFKKVFFEEHPPGLPRGKGDVGERESLLSVPNCNTPVKDLTYKDLLTRTFTLASHERGIKTWCVPTTYPECLLRKNVSVSKVQCRMSYGSQHWKSNWQGKDCRTVQRITTNIVWSS